MKEPIFNPSNNRLVKRHSEIATMNDEKFYDSRANAGKENKESAPPSTLTGSFPVSLAPFKHDTKTRAEKQK